MATKSYLTALALILAAGALPVLAQTADDGTAETQPEADQGMADDMDMGGMAMPVPHFDFAGADTNGDGKITKEELMAHRQTMLTGADADGDGLISAEELAAHMKARMAERIDERAKARVAAQDANGDGKLSAEELIAPPMPMRMFDRLDADGDGAVSQEEIAKAREMMRGRMGGKGMRDGMHDGHGMGHHRGMGWFGWGGDN